MPVNLYLDFIVLRYVEESRLRPAVRIRISRMAYATQQFSSTGRALRAASAAGAGCYHRHNERSTQGGPGAPGCGAKPAPNGQAGENPAPAPVSSTIGAQEERQVSERHCPGATAMNAPTLPEPQPTQEESLVRKCRKCERVEDIRRMAWGYCSKCQNKYGRDRA